MTASTSPPLIRSLLDTIGVQYVAFAANTTPANVYLWLDGDATPDEPTIARLHLLHEVVQLAMSSGDSAAVAAAFVAGMNPSLADVSPLMAIRSTTPVEAIRERVLSAARGSAIESW